MIPTEHHTDELRAIRAEILDNPDPFAATGHLNDSDLLALGKFIQLYNFCRTEPSSHH